MPNLFISYRREDSEDITGRICDALHARFGAESVFMDIDNIPFGVDFREHLYQAVGRCDVLLAVIGGNWLDVRIASGPNQGERRLDNPGDFVRIEVEAALSRGVPVIPLLVGGAAMPSDRDLPDSLKPLAFRNATEIRSGSGFRDQMQRLIRGIEQLLDAHPPGEPEHHPERNRPVSRKVVGIDLGTTNSVVSVFEGEQTVIIPGPTGNRTTASVVLFSDKGEVLVGEVARRQAVLSPRETISSIKRFIGRRRNEIELSETPGYQLVGEPHDLVRIDVHGRQYLPQQISAHILRSLKQSAESYLGESVQKAVITVPAYFDDSQRTATRDAGTIAGLEVLRVINEPTAAAMAYKVACDEQATIAVYDLGGGTFDVTILTVAAEDAFTHYQVYASAGDSRLGGDDFDLALADDLAERFRTSHGIDLKSDSQAWARLLEAGETAKRELSAAERVVVNLPFLAADASGPKHLQDEVTRERFEALIQPLLDRTRDCCERALTDSNLKPTEIADVLLVGGSTRIPAVRRLVEDFFGRKPNTRLNPDEAVAIGAGIQGAVLAGSTRDVLLLDVTTHSLGIETRGGVLTTLIERGTTIPCDRKQTFTTTRDDQKSVRVRVFEGEKPMAAQNRLLGEFKLTGIRPAPSRVPKIEVSFDVDYNGILHVTAMDLATGNAQSIQVAASSRMSADDIRTCQVEMGRAGSSTSSTV